MGSGAQVQGSSHHQLLPQALVSLCFSSPIKWKLQFPDRWLWVPNETTPVKALNLLFWVIVALGR